MIDNLGEEPPSPVLTPAAVKLRALINAVSVVGPLNFLPDRLPEEDEAAMKPLRRR